jgi:hypothetical protein
VSKERVAGCATGWKESLNGKNWELTTWFRITCWRKLAEATNQFMEKGSQVFVEGSLRALVADAACSTITFAGDYDIHLFEKLPFDHAVTIDGAGHHGSLSGHSGIVVLNGASFIVTLHNLTAESSF